MNKISTVRLERYRLSHLKQLTAFTLPDEQEPFTALPSTVLPEEAEGRHPIVIVNEGAPVGFFILHTSERVKEYTEHPRALLLTAFSIDYKQQGKGFAKLAMQQIPAFVAQELPGYDEVVLAVNHKNLPAQQLYQKVGFHDTGRRKMGAIGEQYIYSFSFRGHH
ncbi:GNAT family N-acetyltransferase [Ammoniphilus sp. YIM 78166]|uniref:GNAT family N-acetyltransferase n=1 Tax=Ammoniphilus sp. YIM 78166 TaxID=1644106 RepID=UPI00107067CF|nr:GNAT family N-acetyltransferase [Ammoniphilus sp. YIM 78166]